MLSTFKIYLDDGTDYVTSMAVGVTLADATEYFANRNFTSEDFSGQEFTTKVIKIEQIFPKNPQAS